MAGNESERAQVAALIDQGLGRQAICERLQINLNRFDNHRKKLGKRVHRRRVTDQLVCDVKKLRATGLTLCKIAERVGFSYWTVSQIINGAHESDQAAKKATRIHDPARHPAYGRVNQLLMQPWSKAVNIETFN